MPRGECRAHERLAARDVRGALVAKRREQLCRHGFDGLQAALAPIVAAARQIVDRDRDFARRAGGGKQEQPDRAKDQTHG